MLDKSLLEQCLLAKESLLNHEVISFPTETVMGLGVYYDDDIAYHRLNEIKRRPEDKPYTLMLAKKEDIGLFGVINERIKRIIDKFMPGPLTILISPKNDIPSYVTHNGPTLGVRIPTNKEALTLLEIVGKPLLVPSANRSGEKPALSSDEVKEIFLDEIKIVIDGKCISGKPSTIVNLTQDEPILIREGSITFKEIMDVWHND